MEQNPIEGEVDLLLNRFRSKVSPFRNTLREIHAKYKDLKEGAVADYIPELSTASPDWFGVSVVTTDGRVFDVGNHEQSFTIQSISKPFVYGLALEDHGRESVLQRVGVEPTGEAFNSIVLDEKSNRPFNPMVNAGAIATTGMVKGENFAARIKRVLEMFSCYAGREIFVDNAVFMSERATGHRNRAIGHLMLNFGMIDERLEETLELYFQQCSLMVTCHDLAVMGATIANGGVNPLTAERAVSQEHVKDIISIMMSCGMYDYSGEWAYRVGIPAKSGVGGGIVAVIPGEMGIGIFSPPLDEKGNSVRGIRVCRDLSERYKLHIFESRDSVSPFGEQRRDGEARCP